MEEFYKDKKGKEEFEVQCAIFGFVRTQIYIVK